MLSSSAVDVFSVFVKTEEDRVSKFTNLALNGPENPDVMLLSKQWRTDALRRLDQLSEQLGTLQSASNKVAMHPSMVNRIRAAMNMQWLLSRVAEHLVDGGFVPPAWDSKIKPPSFDHVLLFLHSSDPNPDAVAKRKKLNAIFNPSLWRKLRAAEFHYSHALDWCFPQRHNGRMQMMCLDGCHDAPTMEKAVKFINYDAVDIVPCNVRPAASTDAYDSAAVEVTKAGDVISMIEDEIVALVQKNPPNSELIEEKKKQLADAKVTLATLHAHVLELCKASLADTAQEHPLRPFLDTQFLLARVALCMACDGLLPFHWDDETEKSPVFDHVLQVLHSTDPDPAAVENREKLRAAFTEDEWKFFIGVNAKCFNALYSAEPPMVDGYPELFCMSSHLTEDDFSEVASLLKRDFYTVPISPFYLDTYNRSFICGSRGSVSLKSARLRPSSRSKTGRRPRSPASKSPPQQRSRSPASKSPPRQRSRSPASKSPPRQRSRSPASKSPPRQRQFYELLQSKNSRKMQPKRAQGPTSCRRKQNTGC